MIERIDAVKREGNTLGGICEVVCDGLPVGLGSHVVLGSEAGRPARRRDPLDPGGEGRGDGDRFRSGAPDGSRGA